MADKKIVTEEALGAIASDIKTALGTKADTSSIPTKVSDLTNDSDFQTGDDVDTTIATAIANKADIDGEYDLMTVGNAKQLKSNVGENDKVPYNFRTSGGSIDIGDRETDMLVGGTVAFNQLLPELDSTSYGATNATASYNNGVCTFTATAQNGYIGVVANKPNLKKDHKYFCNIALKSASDTTDIKVRFASGYKDAIVNPTTVWTNFSYIINALADVTSSSFNVADTKSSGFVDVLFKNFMFIDLTQMFGSTIADYIYSLEQGTTGAGVAWFKKLFPKPYYAYNAGELMSVKTSAHVMTGFNQLKLNRTEIITSATVSNTTPRVFNENQVWVGITNNNYFYNNQINSYSIGANSVTVNNRGVAYGVGFPIRIIPDTVYYGISSNGLSVGFYDINGNWLSGTTTFNPGSIFTTPENAFWAVVIFAPATVNTNIVFNNPNINLSWDGERNGEYEPYEVNEYALDSDLELRGIPKLDANNNLYYDGDEYESDGTVTRKYGIVDLGTLNWVYSSSYYVFTADLPDVLYKSSGYDNLICLKYNNSNVHSSSSPDGTIYTRQTYGINGIGIKDSNYTDKDTFKAAMSGVYLIYELATPTTETADAYQNPQIVNDFGTEEYVDNRAVAIPVGHDTFYQANLRAKLEMSPDSPSGNGDYIVRQTDGQNEYVVLTKELPTLPSTDGTYTLKCTVSGGTPTLSWVADT